MSKQLRLHKSFSHQKRNFFLRPKAQNRVARKLVSPEIKTNISIKTFPNFFIQIWIRPSLALRDERNSIFIFNINNKNNNLLV